MRYRAWWELLRDVSLFIVGLVLVINESGRAGSERPTLLILYAAMMGLPAFLQTDVRRRERKETEELERDETEERERKDRAELERLRSEALERARKATGD